MRVWLLILLAALALPALMLRGRDRGHRTSERAEPARVERESAEAVRTSVHITVLDADSREPIAGAIVVFESWVDGALEETRLQTGANGACGLVGEFRGVRVAIRGYGAQRRNELEASIEFLLERATQIELTVVDEEGAPLPRATAALAPAPEIRFEADDAGHICLRAADRVQIAAPGCATRIVEPKSARVVLEQGFVAAGRVVDSSGAPLAGIEVSVEQGDGHNSRSSYDATLRTDAQGRFCATGFSAGRLYISVCSKGFCPADVRASTGETDLELVLYRAVSMRVRIGFADGRPATEAKLVHLPAGQPAWEQIWYLVEAEDDGTYLLGEYLQLGAHKLAVGFGGLAAEQTIVLAEGEHYDVRLVLGPAKPEVYSYCKVRVLDTAGHPVEGATVDRHERTNAAGLAVVRSIERVGRRLELTIMPPRRLAERLTGASLYIRTIAKPEQANVVDVQLGKPAVFELEVVGTRGEPVALRELSLFTEHKIQVGEFRWMVHPDFLCTVHLWPRDETLAPRFLFDRGPGRYRVVMYPPSALTGRLVDEAGRPLAGVRFNDVVTDADGRFRVENVGVDHPVRLYVGRGRVPEAVISAVMRPGHDHDVGDVVLGTPRRLTGRVLDRHGRPLGGASVAARPFFGGSNARAFTTSHADGSFSMRVAPMTRHLEIEKAGHGLRVVRVDGPLEVTLPAPGKLEIERGAKECRIGWVQPMGVLWGEWAPVQPSYPDFAPGRLIIERRYRNGGESRRDEVIIVEGETTYLPAERVR